MSELKKIKPFTGYEISACLPASLMDPDGTDTEIVAVAFNGFNSTADLSADQMEKVFWTLYGVEEEGGVVALIDRHGFQNAVDVYSQITGLYPELNPMVTRHHLPR